MRIPAERWAFVFVVAASASILAQQPRDNRAPAAGAAILAGRVLTRDADSRPLRKTIVTLRSDDGRIHRTAITDDGGAFLFGGLPAGRYGLDASRRGWPTVAYGAARPHQRGTRIEVADGERVDDLTIHLPHGAVLTGSVVDHTGRPMAHTAILALRFSYLNGERRVTRYREDYTDERGHFRIYGLASGEYLVASGGVPMAFENVGTIHAIGEANVRQIVQSGGPRGSAVGRQDPFGPPTAIGYAPIYYPGTPFRAQSMPITLAAGEERSALDFEVAPAQALTVQGLVDRPRGLPPAVGVRLTLRTAGDELASGYVGDDRQTSATPSGSFTFASVPPGAYELTATVVQDGRTTLWASSALTVTGDHAPHLLLSLRPALTLSGRVAFESGAAPDLSSIRIVLQRLPAGESHVASVDASGAFVVSDLVPGRYRLAASAGGPREPSRTWSAKSFAVNGAEMLEAPLDLRSNVAGAVVTLTDRYARLSGVVRNSAGRGAPEYFVVVFPADSRLWTPLSRRIHAVRPFSDGRYLVEHLPPGDYRLAVVADIEEGEWLDRSLLQRLAGAAMGFDVSEGQGLVKDVSVQ